MTKPTGERTKRKTTTRNPRRRLTTNSGAGFRDSRERKHELYNDLFFIDVLHSPPSEILDKAG